MRIDRLATTTAVVALHLLLALPAVAQRASLERVDSLIAAGQTESARALLAEWKQQNATASGAAAARATFLGARLAVDAEAAEDGYLSVALSHPTSEYAAAAWLRLGQARLAAGDSKQAIVYFERLLADYPRSREREEGTAWLARARSTMPVAPAASAAPPKVSTARSDVAPERRPAHTVQVGAFREPSGARAVARALAQAGFGPVRLAKVPDNSLIRVRVGEYESAAAAQAAAAKLKSAGFSAAIVADRQRETPYAN